jgi:pseudouridylate synthase
VDEEVAAALADGRPVVALESTIIAHGLPRPDNLRVAREIEAAARAEGAVPATVAVLGGEVRVGLDAAALEEIAARGDVAKLGVRDLGPALARGVAGATTVASTAYIAARAGIGVFATGGLGGVHRGAATTFDESGDLLALAGAPLVVVCAGVKSILDVGATLERLETLSVPVLGYGTDRLAGFYLADSGHPVPWRVETPEEVADVQRARRELGLPQAVVVANPLPEAEQMDPALHDRVLAEALAAADAGGVAGVDVTPFVLARFHESTAGESLRANVRLVLRNAALAGRIAGALAT